MSSFEEFASLLALLNSADNDTRSKAEEVLDKLESKTKLSCLLRSMATAQIPLENRVLAAVLARRQIRNDYEKSFKELPDVNKVEVKRQLLELMTQEGVREIRIKMSEVVSALAEMQLEESDQQASVWPELCHFILKQSKSETSELRESALRIFSNVSGLFTNYGADGKLSLESLQAIGALLVGGFTDPDIRVRQTAFKAIRATLDTFCDDDAVMKSLSDIVPLMLETLTNCLKEDQDDSTCLSVLVEICDESSAFLRPHLQNTIQLCYTILTNQELEESMRHLALECIISLTENLPAAMRKNGQRYTDPLCQAMLKMMTDIEEEQDWSQNDTPDDDDEQSNAVTGETSLDRFACALGGKQVLDVIVRLVPQMLRSTTWQDRYAGLMAISACGEGCHKPMQQVLGSIIDTVVPMLNDSHPRVRYAACNALGQLSTDFSPKMQNQFHAKVLPGLVNVLDDSANPRVQSHAAAALINFCENCPKNILNIYLDQLVLKLDQVMTAKFQDLVQNGKKMVLEQVVTTVAALADAVEDGFTKHYERFVPGLKYIIQHAIQPELRLLRGKTIECISLIALAVGKEKFMADSREIIELLLKAQTESTDFSADDPQMTYMISAWARICRLLGPDFQPFLPSVMGPLMKVAASEPECAILDEEEHGENAGADWAMVKLNENQNFAINTSGIEDKATACSLLVCYAKEIKSGFLPYVEEVTKLMLKLTKFYFSDEVRSASAEIFPHLLEIAKTNGEAYQRTLWADIAPVLLKVMDGEPEREVLGDFLLSIANCIKAVGPNALDLPQLQTLSQLMQSVFSIHFQKHDERVNQRQDEDYDEEEETRLLSEKDEDEYVLSKLCDIMRALFITHGAEMLPFFEQLLPSISMLLEPNRPWSDFQWALCFFDDLLEHVGGERPEVEHYRGHIQGLLLKGCSHAEPGVRQTACYGVGVAAMRGGPAYVPWLQEVLPSVLAIVDSGLRECDNNLKNLPDELGLSVDNAISAVGKIMEYRPEVLASIPGLHAEALFPRWLHWLPILHDDEEVPHVYGFLCKLMEANHPLIISQPLETLPHIVHCFAASLVTEALKPDQPVYQRVMALTRQNLSNAEMLAQCLLKMSDEEKKVLEKALAVGS